MPEFDWAKGLNTRTSKKALSFLVPQNPSAAMSSLAPFILMAEVGRDSLDRGVRTGSVQTLEQTSVIKEVER